MPYMIAEIRQASFVWGARASADILRNLGAHLGTLTEAAAAQREADAATKDGRRPH